MFCEFLTLRQVSLVAEFEKASASAKASQFFVRLTRVRKRAWTPRQVATTANERKNLDAVGRADHGAQRFLDVWSETGIPSGIRLVGHTAGQAIEDRARGRTCSIAQ